MTIELRILSGSRAGERERFDKSVITIGRHPLSDLRFDPQTELEVSTRHAELRESDHHWTIHDLSSTNGTFVNGERVPAGHRVHTGDVLDLGAGGPRVEVHLDIRSMTSAAGTTTEMEAMTRPSAAKPRRDTNVRIAEAVMEETASLKRMAAIAIGAVIVIAAVALALSRRQSSTRERELLSTIARSESASAPLQRTVTAMRARDSLFSRQLSERDALSAREMARGRQMAVGTSGESRDSVARLSERVALDTRLRQAMTQMDFPRVHDMNDSSVALIASDIDGTYIAGTAFAISSGGELVTNKHVVRSASGAPPRRIRVLFANTTEWLAAHFVRASETDDLALIQVDGTGPYPTVAGVSRAGSDTRVGSPVATIGYPHAVDTPMEGTGLNIRARTTMTAGFVSKRLGDVLQIDSYAGKGSSGSPVFDVHGSVVGVVYGGEAESQGRIVYAVPAERLAAFLGSAAIVR
ncbi:MAG: trypsin-like peptidase domain-containing protein [bacterium]